MLKSLVRLTGSVARFMPRRRKFFPHPWTSQRWCATTVPAGGTPILGTKAREAYLFVYTCKVCETRSERKISKRAYHHGVVLVKCPGCEKNHLVADNLKWFDDHPITIQDIMKAQGESVVTGTVDESWNLTSDPPTTSRMVDEVVHIEGMCPEEIESRISTVSDHVCHEKCSH